MQLSDQAVRLLVLIGDNSVIEDDGICWVPGPTTEHSETLGGPVLVGGAGDARIITSLVKKGLIRLVPELGRYAARITEEGRLLVERMRESGTLPRPNERR